MSLKEMWNKEVCRKRVSDRELVVRISKKELLFKLKNRGLATLQTNSNQNLNSFTSQFISLIDGLNMSCLCFQIHFLLIILEVCTSRFVIIQKVLK